MSRVWWASDWVYRCGWERMWEARRRMETISSFVSEVILVTWRSGRDEEAEKWTRRRGGEDVEGGNEHGTGERKLERVGGCDDREEARVMLVEQSEEMERTWDDETRDGCDSCRHAARVASLVTVAALMTEKSVERVLSSQRQMVNASQG